MMTYAEIYLDGVNECRNAGTLFDDRAIAVIDLLADELKRIAILGNAADYVPELRSLLYAALDVCDAHDMDLKLAS